MAMGTKSLGRGLSAILGGDFEEEKQSVLMVHLKDVVPGRYQPRSYFDEESLESLVASIKEKGIIQPIIVRPLVGSSAPYEIVAGERRWRSAQKAGLDQIPVLVRSFSDAEALETAIIENVQRQDLNALEEAEGYQKLIEEFNHTQDALGRIIGKSRSHIANTLRLLNLPEEVKEHIRNGKLSAGHARPLIGKDDAVALANSILSEGLNVRSTEKLANAKKGALSKNKHKEGSSSEGDHSQLSEMLTNLFGLKSEIFVSHGSGKLVVHFKKLEQLDGLLEKFSK